MSCVLDPEERTSDGEAARRHEDALYGISCELDLSAAKRRNSCLNAFTWARCYDIVVAAALAVGQIEAVARERFGRAGAAKMNYGGDLLVLLRTGRRAWPV